MDTSNWFFIGQKWDHCKGAILEVVESSSKYKRTLILKCTHVPTNNGQFQEGKLYSYNICVLMQVASELT